MRRMILGAGLALLMAAPAWAQSLSADVSLARDSRQVTTVNVEDLKAIVVASGYKVDAVGTMGAVSVRGKTPDGLVFMLIGNACEGSVCYGVNMQIRYDSDSDVTLQKINTAAVRYAAVALWWDQGEATWGLSRYVVLDEGVTMGNVKANLAVLMAANPKVVEVIWPN